LVHDRTRTDEQVTVAPRRRFFAATVRLLVRHVKDGTSPLRFLPNFAHPFGSADMRQRRYAATTTMKKKKKSGCSTGGFLFSNVIIASTNDGDSHTATSFWIRRPLSRTKTWQSSLQRPCFFPAIVPTVLKYHKRAGFVVVDGQQLMTDFVHERDEPWWVIVGLCASIDPSRPRLVSNESNIDRTPPWCARLAPRLLCADAIDGPSHRVSHCNKKRSAVWIDASKWFSSAGREMGTGH
jgi:hypothetical protein